MLWIIGVLLVILWIVGWLGFHILGAFIHIFLFVAVVVFILALIGGRRSAT